MLPDTPLEIITADQLNDTELVVDFSDGTTALFTAQQLASLAPHRPMIDGSEPEWSLPATLRRMDDGELIYSLPARSSAQQVAGVELPEDRYAGRRAKGISKGKNVSVGHVSRGIEVVLSR